MTLILSGTNGVSDIDGSAATPAIRGTDANTGIFFPAADTIAFSEGGVESMRIDSDGDVGMGTSSPSYKLHVVKGASDNAVVIDNGGGVGDNTTPYLAFSGTNGGSNFIRSRIRAAFPDATGGGLIFDTGTSGSMSERMRIGSSGQVTLASDTLYITNIPTTSTAGNCLISSGEGNKFYRSTSSIKYKRNVVDMQRGIADVQQLRPVNFNGVSDFDGDKVFAGFIAEEVESLGFKEFVIYDEKGEPDGLQYANMTALLVKAIQEQQTIIQSLTTRITALEAK